MSKCWVCSVLNLKFSHWTLLRPKYWACAVVGMSRTAARNATTKRERLRILLLDRELPLYATRWLQVRCRERCQNCGSGLRSIRERDLVERKELVKKHQQCAPCRVGNRRQRCPLPTTEYTSARTARTAAPNSALP